jgi:hypothetical protein
VPFPARRSSNMTRVIMPVDKDVGPLQTTRFPTSIR